MNSKHIAVIGGGICGLSTAFALHQRGYKNISLFESKSWPNKNGSSHGHSRITRSAYSSSFYVALMQKSHNQYWPELEKALQKQLIFSCKGLLFGPEDGLIQDYYTSVNKVGVDVEPITVKQAQQLFPQISFKNNDLVLLDHTAGIIASQQTIEGLVLYLKEQGVSLYSNTHVTYIDDQMQIYTTKGIFKTDKIISCLGPWTAQLFPYLQKELIPLRQQVFYLEGREENAITPSEFPVWVEVGMTPEENWYGLPSFGSSGFKIARHRLSGIPNDPDLESPILQTHRQEMLDKAKERFPISTGNIISEERCIYTIRNNEDYLIDQHIDNPNIIIASGFSGHGFKLAPLCGALIVDMIEGKDAPVPFQYTKPLPH